MSPLPHWISPQPALLLAAMLLGGLALWEMRRRPAVGSLVLASAVLEILMPTMLTHFVANEGYGISIRWAIHSIVHLFTNAPLLCLLAALWLGNNQSRQE